MTQGNGQFSTVISPIQANKATFKSQVAVQKHEELTTDQLRKQFLIEQTSRLTMTLCQRQSNRSQKEVYFQQWKSFMQNARLAESAFEQLMQMHQRHSKSRYQSAVALIAKIDKKMCQRQALEQIIYAAIAKLVPVYKPTYHPRSPQSRAAKVNFNYAN